MKKEKKKMKNYDKENYRDRLAELNVCGCIINNP